jgi:hypothetical protein
MNQYLVKKPVWGPFITALLLALGIVCLNVSPALAGGHYEDGIYIPDGVCISNCGPPGGSDPVINDDSAERDRERVRKDKEAADAAEAARLKAERERKAEEKRRKAAEFKHGRDDKVSNLKGETGSAFSELKDLADTDDFGLKESDSDPGDHMSPTPHGDSLVVDGRGPRDGDYLTNQVPELMHSPAADRISKGFQAVINHDWPVALAWWQDALKRDPGNAALQRSVDLARWMVDRRHAGASEPVSPLGSAIYAASHGDSADAIRQFERVKAENPTISQSVDDMLAVLRQRQAKDAQAAYWNRELENQSQQLVELLVETGINHLSVGDETGARAAFNDADFFSMGLPAGK